MHIFLNEKKKGFTLMELLIVVVIIGILALAMRLYWPKLTMGAKVNTWKSDMDALQTALNLYNNDHGGHYPDEPDSPEPFSQWAHSQGLDKYMQKPLKNPFYPDIPVIVGGDDMLQSDLNASDLPKNPGNVVLEIDIFDPDAEAHLAFTKPIGGGSPGYTIIYSISGKNIIFTIICLMLLRRTIIMEEVLQSDFFNAYMI